MSYNQKQEPGETFFLPVSEELYRTLFEQVSDGVFVADSQGRCLEVNQHGCEMLGYTRQELLAFPSLQRLIPAEDQEHNPIRLNEIQPGTPVWAEQRLRCKNGRFLSTEIKLWRLTDGRLLGAVRDITAYKQIQEERLAHLHFLENMERINQAIHGTNDLEQMMINVLDALLDVFNCDRAWLVSPCDPESATWQTPMERTRPNYPGVLPIGVELPLEPAGAEVFRLLLNANGPLVFGPESPFQVPAEMQQAFHVQSFIVMAFYPKIGKPWSFGLHQCSYPRVWTQEEQDLFQEIGRRLADGITTLLAYRDLQESELRYREIFENVSESRIAARGYRQKCWLICLSLFLQPKKEGAGLVWGWLRCMALFNSTRGLLGWTQWWGKGQCFVCIFLPSQPPSHITPRQKRPFCPKVKVKSSWSLKMKMSSVRLCQKGWFYLTTE